MAVVMKPCSHCGELYPTKRSTSKYCSSRCQSASFRAVQEVKPYTIKHKHPSQLRKEAEEAGMPEQQFETLHPDFTRVPVLLVLDDGFAVSLNVARDSINTLVGSDYERAGEIFKIAQVVVQQ